MYYFVLVLFSPFSIAITSIREERANLSVFRTFVDLRLFGFVCFLFLLSSGKGYGLCLWHSLDFSLSSFVLQNSMSTKRTLWSVFALRSMGSEGPELSSCGQRRLWSDWADAQADPNLRWAHIPFWRFCHALVSLRKHAYSNILKILPPKNENFQLKNPNIFQISAQNIDCGYSLEPPRRGGSNEYPESMF